MNEQQVQNEVLPGVTPEAAAPIDPNVVQPIAQTTEGAQPEVEGQGPVVNQEAIPYERFKEVNDSLKTAQQQLQLAQQQNLLYQTNLPNQQSTVSPLEQIAEKLKGIDDDGTGSLNINEAQEMISAFQGEISNMNATQQANQEQSFLANNPDYGTKVGRDIPGIGFQYSPEFLEMLQTNPVNQQQLQMMAKNPVQQAQAALQMATNYQAAKNPQVVTALPNIPGIINAAPPSISAIPTSGDNQVLTTYANMANADFLNMVDRTPKTA